MYHYIAYNRVKFDTFWKKNLPKPKTKPHLGGENIKEGCEQRRSVAIKTDRR